MRRNPLEKDRGVRRDVPVSPPPPTPATTFGEVTVSEAALDVWRYFMVTVRYRLAA